MKAWVLYGHLHLQVLQISFLGVGSDSHSTSIPHFHFFVWVWERTHRNFGNRRWEGMLWLHPLSGLPPLPRGPTCPISVRTQRNTTCSSSALHSWRGCQNTTVIWACKLNISQFYSWASIVSSGRAQSCGPRSAAESPASPAFPPRSRVAGGAITDKPGRMDTDWAQAPLS